MSNIDIIRAWKDEEYRNSLSKEQLSQLPENPAGTIELTDKTSQTIAGGSCKITCGIRRVCGGTKNFSKGPACCIIRETL